MEKPYIPVKIVKIEPDSVYMDTVYDQFVFAELPNGKTIGIFDHRMIAKPEMISKSKKITIYAFLSMVTKVYEPRYDIEPNSVYPPCNGLVYYGQISGEMIDHDAVIDIGTGKILSDLHKKPDDLKKGDFVKIYALRTDLDEIFD